MQVILNVDDSKAYIQNADTNKYLEDKIASVQSAVDGKAAASHNHTISDVTDLQTALDAKAASDHNQAASTITAGTFAGQVVANSSGQTYSTSLLRNSKLVTADTTPTNNGEICWTYK